MIDTKRLLEQFMGGGQDPPGASNRGDLLKGAAAGGLLGLLVGNKKARRMAGGLVGYGGAAAAGALAFKAWQNWQEGKRVETAPVATQEDVAHVDPRFLPDSQQGGNGRPFALTLVTAMIAAAKADGHIDAGEQTAIFKQVEEMGLDTESKAFVFDALNRPVDINQLVAGVDGVEQASEVYLVSRLAIDVDHPAERAHLEVLANRLGLPTELVAHLDHQVDDAPDQTG
ncbi:tellurite resistance TerB family protein [Halofilum ochraceum]|uniref:tellurite resistance TerB family protein n=1 Tax=Halofilum ochraceum TaxID=1611323 RepID=UPI0008D8FF74|nr:tellurite resistance TerB family protein [Halofilum ochraceum]